MKTRLSNSLVRKAIEMSFFPLLGKCLENFCMLWGKSHQREKRVRKKKTKTKTEEVKNSFEIKMGMEPRHKMIDFQSEEGVLFIYMGGGQE